MKSKLFTLVFACATLLPAQSPTIIRDNDRPSRQIFNQLFNFNTTVFAGVTHNIETPPNKVLVIEQIGSNVILPSLGDPTATLSVTLLGHGFTNFRFVMKNDATLTSVAGNKGLALAEMTRIQAKGTVQLRVNANISGPISGQISVSGYFVDEP